MTAVATKTDEAKQGHAAHTQAADSQQGLRGKLTRPIHLTFLGAGSGFCPNLWRIRENGTSVGVMRAVRCKEAFFARTPAEQETDRAEADALEAEICRSTRIPLGYMESFYNLRVHLGYLRNRLKEAGD